MSEVPARSCCRCGDTFTPSPARVALYRRRGQDLSKSKVCASCFVNIVMTWGDDENEGEKR